MGSDSLYNPYFPVYSQGETTTELLTIAQRMSVLETGPGTLQAVDTKILPLNTYSVIDNIMRVLSWT